MPRNVVVQAAQVVAGLVQFNGGGINHLVQAVNGDLYLIYIDSQSDVAFRKSTNNGLTWGTPTVIFTGTATAVAVWYDRWSDISAGLIHVAYTESVTDDTLYRTINTESSDALSTQTVIFAGSSTATGGCLAITRARGGNVYCATMIDNGAEGGFFRLPNANVPNGAWDAARTTVFEAAGGDQVILQPGWAADNQDIMAFFWDASADEISRKVYDDSGNSWAETSISGSMGEGAFTSSGPHFAAAVDIANSRSVLVAWNGVGVANSDLRAWTITESAITALTDVVTNDTSGSKGLAAISINSDAGMWMVFYGGRNDLGVTIPIYCKCSGDSGTTWGPETEVTDGVIRPIKHLISSPRVAGSKRSPVVFFNDIALDEFMCATEMVQPRANCMVGV